MPLTDRGGLVHRGEIKNYGDNLIEMRNAPLTPRVGGTAKFKIKYGHPGREKYPLERKVQFEATFEPAIKAYVVMGYRDIA
jgi:hypothetical protein